MPDWISSVKLRPVPLHMKCGRTMCAAAGICGWHVDHRQLIACTKTELKTRFEMTDRGKCSFVLGIELLDDADGSVTLCQRRM